MQILVILVPVLFGFMGFAVDLGRIYMIRGELKAAANAMALAAASRLIGTDLATEQAIVSAQLALSEVEGFANRYDYGGRSISESEGDLTTEIPTPTFHDTVAGATGEDDGTGSAGAEAEGSQTARHVRVTLRADAPLVFWAFLPQAQERRTPVWVEAVAGLSAPLCTACGIEAFAVAALDSSDETDFGFVANSRYTLGFQCTGPGALGPLPGTIQRIPYVIINRLNEEAEILADESTQTYRIGAGGLPSSTLESRSCFSVNAVEAVWPTAAPLVCLMSRVPAQVSAMVCGLARRFEDALPEACANIPEIETASLPFSIDTDIADVEEHAAYTGNGRRVITIPIVDSLASQEALTVLGFRQFLLEPNANSTNIDPSDQNGRFAALYIGSKVPLRQGRIDGCQLASGPGKVVLHK